MLLLLPIYPNILLQLHTTPSAITTVTLCPVQYNFGYKIADSATGDTKSRQESRSKHHLYSFLTRVQKEQICVGALIAVGFVVGATAPLLSLSATLFFYLPKLTTTHCSQNHSHMFPRRDYSFPRGV